MVSKGLGYLRSNALGALALFVALGGTGYAATGGFTAASNSIKACAGSNGVLKLQTGKKCKRGQKAVSWNQQSVSGAKGATGPSGIAGLNGAPVPNATNAGTAATATNALALGGVPASGFTQRDCGSDTGQVKGFAQIPTVISENFEPVTPSYNCSGGAVEARNIDFGLYRFRFVDNPAEVPLATTIVANGENRTTANVHFAAPGEWEVVVSSGSGFKNEGVSLVLF